MKCSIVIGICLLSLYVCSSHQSILGTPKVSPSEVLSKETPQNGKLHYQLPKKIGTKQQQQAVNSLTENVYPRSSLPELNGFGAFETTEQSDPATASKLNFDNDDGMDDETSEEDTLAVESRSTPKGSVTTTTTNTAALNKGREMDKLIYELVEDEQKEAIRNTFERATLRAVAIKSKLDMKIDETIMMLHNLKNMRRQIENSYNFANKFVNSKVTNDELKRYVVSQLNSSIQQVEHALEFKAKTDSKQQQQPPQQ